VSSENGNKIKNQIASLEGHLNDLLTLFIYLF